MKDAVQCFGQYNESAMCNLCKASRRCHSVTMSEGLDILGAMVEQLVETLPAGKRYRDTDRVSEVVDQVVKPPLPVDEAEDEILVLLGMREGKAEQETEQAKVFETL